MLYLVQSNKMECLADRLIKCLQETSGQGASIFESDQILVQSPGMSQWLKIKIAQSLGITANIEFPLPSSFIWQQYQQHIPDLPAQSAFTKANMTWKLMAILPNLLQQQAFSPIADYLQDSHLIKRYLLAGKIADVYDQYLVYRPEWILHWEAGHDNLPDSTKLDLDETQSWQPILWRALVSQSQALGESPLHRANLHHQLLKVLHNASHLEQNTKPLMVFGISAMPMQQLEVLNALAETRDVLIFWFNPSHHYWGDIVDKKTQAKARLAELNNPSLVSDLLDVGNPLLASWGKLGRDYQDMLLEFELQQVDCFVDNPAKNLLEHIQNDVSQLQYRGTNNPLEAHELLTNGQVYPKIEISADDNSLQIHACHSKVRELEVLHDQLLKRFNDNADWQPGDVIVMMPDVASYAPFIEGVFGSVDCHLAIPFAISDRNVGQVSPIISSFLQVMKLHQSRLTLSEVMTLLEVPAIQHRFDIDQQEFELLQHWLTDAGVRWGWNDQDKQRWNLPLQQQNTWVFGLQRLLAGYAMSSNDLYYGQQQVIAPYADIEGQQAVALGKCYQFISVLLSVLDFCLQKQSIEQKVQQGLGLLSQLYKVDDTEQNALQLLRETMEKMLLHTQQFTAQIDQDVFVSELQQNIQENGVGQRFLAGYVNFCTLMPMRSIPFKMVCLLGMNDADYPRQSVPMGFDLMRTAPSKKGDRSRRLDDRYLFLEALLSSREQLYFSYQGFSLRDNSQLAPSILLSELIEYCQQGFSLAGQLNLNVEQTEQNLLDYLTVEHKLQPFNQAYFVPQSASAGKPKETSRLYSFNVKNQHVAAQSQSVFEAEKFDSHALKPSLEAITHVELALFIEYFQNPAKGFFVQRWQTRFFALGQLTSDEEPFAFDGLDKYQINQGLIQQHLNNEVNDTNTPQCDGAELDQEPNILSSVIDELRAQGKLPAGQSGELALKPLLKKSAQLSAQIKDINGNIGAALRVDIEAVFNELSIVGSIDNLYQQNLILWRGGKLRAKDRIALYLQWLTLCAHGHKPLNKAYFISVDAPYVLPLIEQQLALKLLSQWVSYWHSGANEILHFYPEAAWQWCSSQDSQKTIATFIGNDFVAGEGTEPHIQRVCPNLTDVFDEFSRIAEELLMPLVNLGDTE